jgi:uncharacterized protein YcbX
VSVSRVSELWWYPVKSFAGQHVDRVTVRPVGIPGDRGLALEDAGSGRILSAKHVHKLLEGRFESGMFLLPDGTTFSEDDPEAVDALSSWLGRDVRIVRAAGDDNRPEIEGEEGEMFRGEPGGLHDDSPIHLVTTSTRAYLTSLYPSGRFDPRRFRPNIVIDTGDADGPVEQSWVGSEISMGAARFLVTKPCHRCVITTLPQEELSHDPGILRTVNQLADRETGVYVLARGEAGIDVGDEVSLM